MAFSSAISMEKYPTIRLVSELACVNMSLDTPQAGTRPVCRAKTRYPNNLFSGNRVSQASDERARVAISLKTPQEPRIGSRKPTYLVVLRPDARLFAALVLVIASKRRLSRTMSQKSHRPARLTQPKIV